MLRKYPQLFKDHDLQYPIHDIKLPFADYIAQTKKLVETTRTDLTQDPDKIIDANIPYEMHPELTKTTTGALLVHGLLDSTFQMREIGQRLQQKGLLVRSILLPGHGTTPGDLLNVKLETWLQAVHYGIESLSKTVEKIHLVGFSTGASLCLFHTLKTHPKIVKLILLCPAIKIHSTFDFAAYWLLKLGRFFQRAKWLALAEENDYAKYQSLTLNAVNQVYRLTQALKKQSKKTPPTLPIFFIISHADSTVSPQATVQYFHQYLTPHNKLLIYSSQLPAHEHPQILVRSTVYPKLNIQHFSHICIPNTAENPHYGMNGDYRFVHYKTENENSIYGSFNQVENRIYKFLFNRKIVKVQRRRLTFNPDFEFMIKEIEKFIDT